MNGDRYWLPRDYLWVDAVAFEEALDEAALATSVEEKRAALLAGLTLYGGDLLPSSQLPWVEEEGQRLRERFLDAARRVSILYAEAGEFDAALIWSDRLTREEPLREDYYRLLMKIQNSAGQRAVVARTFERLRAELNKEQGQLIEPEQKTRVVYDRLMAAPEPHDEAGPYLALRPEQARRTAEPQGA